MPALQVRELPEDLYEALRECASNEDRSISQQTIHILRDYLRAYRTSSGPVVWTAVPATPQTPQASTRVDEREQRVRKRALAFERIDALPSFNVPGGFPEPAELVRSARGERDGSALEWWGDAQ